MWYKPSRLTMVKSFARYGCGGTIHTAPARVGHRTASMISQPKVSWSVRENLLVRTRGGTARGFGRLLSFRDRGTVREGRDGDSRPYYRHAVGARQSRFGAPMNLF